MIEKSAKISKWIKILEKLNEICRCDCIPPKMQKNAREILHKKKIKNKNYVLKFYKKIKKFFEENTKSIPIERLTF